MVLADHHSVVFVLANMAGQVWQCGGWHDLLSLAAGGLLYLEVCSWVVCVWLFFAIWPGLGDSRLSKKCTK